MLTRAFVSALLASAAFGAPAVAATFVWNSGTYVPGATSPNPLLAPDVLSIRTGSNKTFNAVSFTNQSGSVDWQAGNIFFGNGTVVTNNALWDAKGDNGLFDTSGAAGTFNNTGIFRKSGGTGDTIVSAVQFTNNGGVIDAQTGRINFTGGDATFNAGTVFQGAGVIAVSASAAFNGAFTASNLTIGGGTYTGGAAAMTGSAAWTSGTVTGTWTVTNGAALNLVTGSNKTFDAATFVNGGTVNQTTGNLFFATGAAVTNNGLWNSTTDTGLFDSSGVAGSFTNNGTFRKSGGTGDTTVGGNGFTSNGGIIDAQTGRINFNGGDAVFNVGTVFQGAGVNAVSNNATFNGAFSSSNLTIGSGIFNGGAAVLNGTAAWTSGSLTGTWTVASGSALSLATGSNKSFDGVSFTNAGSVVQSTGNLFFVNGAAITNDGLWDVTSDNGLFDSSGAPGSFNNRGTFRKSGGGADTVVGAIRFTSNGGIIDAQTGRINFDGGDAVFNAGTVFQGAGVNAVTNSATFSGAFSASNLVLASGTLSGGGAVLSGAAAYNAGTLTGSWTVSNGSSFTIATGSNKTLDAANVTNDGTVVWTNGNLFFANAAVLTNNGTIDARSDNGMFDSSGAAGAVTNNGLIVKSAGAGTTTLTSGVPFVNNGTVNVLSGTIALPWAFTNDGTLGGTGTFSSTNLVNAGAIAPGAPGASGTLQLAGSFTQAASGQLRTQLASSSSADLFNISGSASLGGTLALSCILGCAINDGDSFVILDSVGALSGTFANVTTSGFLNGFSYSIDYDYAADLVRLTVLDAGMSGAVPEPASWVMMIAGFALAGAAARRRRGARVLA